MNITTEIFSRHKGEKNELIPMLQDMQNNYGYLSEKSMEDVSRFLNISASKVYSVATFYAQFRFVPQGKVRITVCRGTACHVCGAPQILDEIERQLGIKEGETTSDLEYTLETVACVGCCALAPCLLIDGEVKAKLTPRTTKELFIERG